MSARKSIAPERKHERITLGGKHTTAGCCDQPCVGEKSSRCVEDLLRISNRTDERLPPERIRRTENDFGEVHMDAASAFLRATPKFEPPFRVPRKHMRWGGSTRRRKRVAQRIFGG